MARLARDNRALQAKLAVAAVAMFGFGYGLVPMYRAICESLGIDVLARAEARDVARVRASTQVDTGRVLTIEFDANARGPWSFRPERASLQVHPGELVTMTYEFRNEQDRAVTAQAIPSYAPQQAAPHVAKLECFCFTQHTLAPRETRRWPVVFVVDPRLPRDVTTVTLSYTFFEVAGKNAPTS